jgi:iron(III) transport system ATP-binding protein
VARLTFRDVSKHFGRNTAVRDVSLDAGDGEFIALLGPSGCGKTTMLRLAAGFETLDGGSITIGDRMVSGPGVHVPPEERRTGIVFQSYALWPHMTVAENVAFALKVQGAGTAEREVRVAKALDAVGLSALRDRAPAQLSGGQRQRVALARCLAMRPDIVLLDEPLANLDVHLRASLEEEFAAFHRRTGTTMLYITHNQAEAMALADRIAVMDEGRILQFATPSVLYREPASAAVARFIGGGMILPGRIVAAPAAGRIMLEVLGQRALVRCPADTPASGTATVCVRAGDLAVAPAGSEGILCRVGRLVYQGGGYMADVTPEAQGALSLRIALPEPSAHAPGDAVKLVIRDGWLLP